MCTSFAMPSMRQIVESDNAVFLSVAFFLISAVQRRLGQDNNALLFFQVALAIVTLYGFHSLTYDPLAHWRIYPLLSGFGLEYFLASQESTLVFTLPALITVILICLLPVSPPAVLIGKHTSIGTTSFNFSHAESDEHCMHDIPVQCWFPMKDKNKGTSNSPLSGAMLWTSGHPREQERELFALLAALARNQRLPVFALRHLALTRTNSCYCNDLNSLSEAEKSYPVVIYSHGMYGWRQIHHTACEKLASEGFVVFAIDHQPDSTLARPFKDLKRARGFHFSVPSDSSLKEDHTFHARGVDRRQKQILALLHFLPSISNRIDLNSILCFGHSYGGGTCASLACTQKELLKGAVVLDGWFYPLNSQTRRNGSNAPMLMLSSHKWPSAKYQCPYRLQLCESTKKTSKFMIDMILIGSNHQNFCDSHYIASHFLMRGGAMLGRVDDPKKVIDAIDAIIVGFLKRCLAQTEEGANELHGEQKSSTNLEYFAANYYLSEHSQQSRKLSAKIIRRQLNYIRASSKSSAVLKELQQLNGDSSMRLGIGAATSRTITTADDEVTYDDSYFKKTNDW